MTLKAIADELNVTTMTIYRRLSKAGIDIKELRDDGGEITARGAGVIASLFQNIPTTADNEAAQHVITGVANSDATGVKDRPGGTEAAQVAALTATVEGLRALVAQLEGERDELRRQLAQVTAALQAEQADRQHERQLLTGGNMAAQGQQRRGWWARLFHNDRS